MFCKVEGFLALGFVRAHKVPAAAERTGQQWCQNARTQKQVPLECISPAGHPYDCMPPFPAVQDTTLTFRSIWHTLETFLATEGPQTRRREQAYLHCLPPMGSEDSELGSGFPGPRHSRVDVASKLIGGFYKTEKCVSIVADD